MKQKTIIGLAAMVALAVGIPAIALAHETHTYTIGGKSYQITVGSLNEPIAVDDKTGAYLKVVLAGQAENAVGGLDQTLKVEVSAGDKKKTMDLEPIHGEAGAYRAIFIPTVQTTYSYRFFGTINDKQVDLPFTCNPAGHPASPEDNSTVNISSDVDRTAKRGAYGCPVGRGELGFPEPASTAVYINKKTEMLTTETASAKMAGYAGIGAGALGILLGVMAMARRREM